MQKARAAALAALAGVCLFANIGVASGQPLPAPWLSQDIGTPALAGDAVFASETFRVDAAGADIWDSADQFHYVYQEITGDVDIVARVRSITEAHQWSLAGVMIRETLDAGSRHALAFTSARKGHAFRRRTEPDQWSSHTSGGSGTAPVWLRLVRSGNSFEALRSVDGETWTSMGTDIIAMSETVYVGLAVMSHRVHEFTTAVIDGVRITGQGPTYPEEPEEPAPNESPTVTIRAPANGTMYVAPTGLTVIAAASDVDGSVVSVEFYANSTLLGRDVAAPYSITVPSVPHGVHAVTAIATDDRGASTVSATVSVTVAEVSPPTPTEPPPSGTAPRGVAFTVSDDHETLVTHYVLEIHAEGTTPGRAAAIATSNLGKPEPSSTGDVVVDRSAFFTALAPGSYVATVRAVGGAGSARSEGVTFTR